MDVCQQSFQCYTRFACVSTAPDVNITQFQHNNEITQTHNVCVTQNGTRSSHIIRRFVNIDSLKLCWRISHAGENYVFICQLILDSFNLSYQRSQTLINTLATIGNECYWLFIVQVVQIDTLHSEHFGRQINVSG